MHSSLNIYFELKWEKHISHEEELVFEKTLSVESILSQFFIQFQLSCIILIAQIFISYVYHKEVKDLKHDPAENPILASPGQIN